MHVRRALALAAALPLLLAGCSEEEPQPKMPDPSPVSSASQTPTAEPTQEQEQESPEEFIRRWQAASDRAQMTGDTKPYRQMTKGCEPCIGFADKVEEIYAAGGSVDFAGSRVLQVQPDGPSSNSYKVRIESPRATIVSAQGAAPNTLAGGKLDLHVFLKDVGATWAVRHYTILPTS